MSKEERIDGFLAGYKELCEKFGLCVAFCPLCKQYSLKPWDTVSCEFDSAPLKTQTDKHVLPGEWEQPHVPKETSPEELSASCDSIGQI